MWIVEFFLCLRKTPHNIEPNQEYYRGTRHHCPVKPVKTTGLLKNRKARLEFTKNSKTASTVLEKKEKNKKKQKNFV